MNLCRNNLCGHHLFCSYALRLCCRSCQRLLMSNFGTGGAIILRFCLLYAVIATRFSSSTPPPI
eukprot:SAG31_NODE_983_length_10554_cov_6.049259_10_plen_64_part_00